MTGPLDSVIGFDAGDGPAALHQRPAHAVRGRQRARRPQCRSSSTSRPPAGVPAAWNGSPASSRHDHAPPQPGRPAHAHGALGWRPRAAAAARADARLGLHAGGHHGPRHAGRRARAARGGSWQTRTEVARTSSWASRSTPAWTSRSGARGPVAGRGGRAAHPGPGRGPGRRRLRGHRSRRQRGGRRERLEETLARLDELGLPVRDRLARGARRHRRPGAAARGPRARRSRACRVGGRRLSPLPRARAGRLRPPQRHRPAGGHRGHHGGRWPRRRWRTRRWAPAEPDVIDRLRDWGLRGLEVYYPGWDEPTVEAMAAFAEERGLLATGGSDYHGDRGDYASLAGRDPRAAPTSASASLAALGLA